MAVLICAAHAFSDDAPAVRTHLFILSGQSNMAKLDPDISFTPTLKEALKGDKVIVVKDAEGGKPIRMWHRDWKPATGNRPQASGELYDRLIGRVRSAMEGITADTVTFLWMQGERDAKEGHGVVYADSLRGLVAQLEKDLCRADLFVVLGRLSDHGVDNPDMPHWPLLREIQVKLAEENPRWAWVDTDDLNGPGNNLHYTKDGYRLLGERFAKAALAFVQASQAVAAP